MEVQLHSFLTLALDINERSASCIDHFIFERITPEEEAVRVEVPLC